MRNPDPFRSQNITFVLIHSPCHIITKTLLSMSEFKTFGSKQ